MADNIVDVPGIFAGHAEDPAGKTGCTVVLVENPDGAVGSVDVRGGAPGTRETDLLAPSCLVQRVNAVLLTGGSAFGLDAASGVVRWLEENGRGYDVGGGVRVPIVPAAVLFDLDFADPHVRPDAAMGYRACKAASRNPLPGGRVGAGAGTTVGKQRGRDTGVPGGIGCASVTLSSGLTVAAVVAVNAYGSVVDPDTGAVLAGPAPDGFEAPTAPVLPSNTVIGVVASNADLDKACAKRIAVMAHDGIARAIRPSHTPFDGDAIFTLCTGTVPAELVTVGALAADVVARAIVNAVKH